MLSIETRQKYLAYLELYKGDIDKIEGPLLRAAYKALQDEYFIREKDKDGKYGPDTDILLKNVYAIKKYTKNFKPSEMMCGCGGKYCTGFPVKIDTQLLKNIQSVRNKYGSTLITSGPRCKKYNASIPGSAQYSEHLNGRAFDFDNAETHTLAKRKKVMAYCEGLPKVGYVYSNNAKNSYPWMGNSVHMEVRK